ncbi:MAG: hypothetical protein UZ07_CHB004001906, partial [Chlorobi bacterium OLB7]
MMNFSSPVPRYIGRPSQHVSHGILTTPSPIFHVVFGCFCRMRWRGNQRSIASGEYVRRRGCDARRDNNYARFGNGTPAEKLRWTFVRGVHGGLLVPPLYLDRFRYALLTDRGELAIAEGDTTLHRFTFPNGEHPYPAIAADSAGTLYAVTTHGTLHAVGPDGAERWSKNLRQSDTNAILGYSQPLGMTDGVIIGTSAGTLTRFGSDGNPRWSVQFGAGISPQICHVNGAIVVALSHNDYSISDSLATLDAGTGARRSVVARGGGAGAVG